MLDLFRGIGMNSSQRYNYYEIVLEERVDRLKKQNTELQAKLDKAVEQRDKLLKVVRFYGDPETWIKRDSSSWSKKLSADEELAMHYTHPGTDWNGSVTVRGKLARETLKELGVE